MSRYYKYNYYHEDNWDDFIEGLATILILYLIYQYLTNKDAFLKWTLYGIIGVLVIIGVFLLILKLREISDHKIAQKMLAAAKVIDKIEEETKPVRATPEIKQVVINNKITPEARLLYDALMERRIKCKLEKWDGHKHIDISIPWAKINVEIDGSQHYTNPGQIKSDYKRTYYSARKGFFTIRIPNYIIRKDINQVADAIAKAARDEYYKR